MQFDQLKCRKFITLIGGAAIRNTRRVIPARAGSDTSASMRRKRSISLKEVTSRVARRVQREDAQSRL
jgi:hypothetical protein